MLPIDSNSEHRRVLAMLADASDGCTEPLLLAHSLRLRTLAELIVAGPATTKSETAHAGGRQVDVVRVRITDAGRVALERPYISHAPTTATAARR